MLLWSSWLSKSPWAQNDQRQICLKGSCTALAWTSSILAQRNKIQGNWHAHFDDAAEGLLALQIVGVRTRFSEEESASLEEGALMSSKRVSENIQTNGFSLQGISL